MSQPAPTLRVLFAPDLPYSTDAMAEQWVEGFTQFLTSPTTQVDFLTRLPGAHQLHDRIATLGARVIQAAEYVDKDSIDQSGVTPRYRTRQIIKLFQDEYSEGYDIVITQGLDLSRYVAGNGALQAVQWSIIDDDPLNPVDPTPAGLKSLQVVATGSKLVLTSSPRVRRQLDSKLPSATSKTRLVPVPSLNRSTATENRLDTPTYFLDYARCAREIGALEFHALAGRWVREANPPRVVISNFPSKPSDRDQDRLQKSGLTGIPGLAVETEQVYDSAFLSNQSTIIVPAHVDSFTKSVLAVIADSVGAKTAMMAGNRISHEGLAFTDVRQARPGEFLQFFRNDVPDYIAVPHNGRRLRVVLAGADFKFAGDIVDMLIQRDDIELRIDLFEANAKPQPAKSRPLLDWAEVIIAEFASKNAIWYSQNVRPHQKLIVHLHGYELLQDWIDELDVDKCHSIVVASEFYRQQALDMKNWPADKVKVIPNSVNPADLYRAKNEEARFHVGIVGIVPLLKRPDRALDLIEGLLEHDDRYVLHIKGHSPWNYAWEWKKSAHQDSYREFYRRIGKNPKVASRIAFEPFSPDMGNWLTKIGWLLSPSTRETFHLSAIEGAASGAVPIAWRRAGSDEIIGSQHNVDSTREAIARILSCTDETTYAQASASALKHAEQYSVAQVRVKWLNLLFSAAGSAHAAPTDSAIADISGAEADLLRRVEAELTAQDPESAIAILDENIPLTKNSCGPAKDLELYVRGLAAIDEKRVTQFMPAVAEAVVGGQVVVVKPIGASCTALTLAGVDDIAIDINPPKYLRLNGRYTPIDDSGDLLPDIGTSTLCLTADLRLDRWIQATKTLIQKELKHAIPSPVLVALGPWWVALPVAMAADELQLRYVWVLDDSGDEISALAEVTANPATSNFSQQVIRSAFERADLRIAARPELIRENSPYWYFDGVLNAGNRPPAGLPGLSADTLEAFILSRPAKRLTSPPREILKPMSELRVGLVGTDELKNELSGLVSEVREIPTADYLDYLTADLDVVIIDELANTSREWRGRITHPDPSKVNCSARIFDRARLLGAATIFLHHTEGVLNRQFFATARKADTIISPWLPGIQELLALHPTSINRTGLWMEDADLHEKWALVFRGAGVPISDQAIIPFAKRAKKDVSASEVECISDQETQFKAQDVIDVYIDASDSPISEHLLKSLRKQTLPQELFNVYVVGSETPLLGVESAELVGLESYTSERNWLVLPANASIGPRFLEALWLEASDNMAVSSTIDGDIDDDVPFGTLYPARMREMINSSESISHQNGLDNKDTHLFIPTAEATQI